MTFAEIHPLPGNGLPANRERGLRGNHNPNRLIREDHRALANAAARSRLHIVRPTPPTSRPIQNLDPRHAPPTGNLHPGFRLSRSFGKVRSPTNGPAWNVLAAPLSTRSTGRT